MQIVLAITGGGTQVIGNYLSQGGKSDRFLEAIVPYCMEALDDFIDMKPDSYCDSVTARQMAMAAYERVGKLRPDSNKDERVGLGITCSLIKNEKERLERKNMVYVARQTRIRTEELSFELNKELASTRTIQEQLVASVTSYCLENDIYNLNPKLNNLRDIVNVKYNCAIYPTDILKSKLVSYPWNMNGDFVYSGSFNPLHDQHKAIVTHLRLNHTNYNVFGELSVTNVDKVSIDAISLSDRVAQIKAEKVFDNLLITKAAKFVEKFRIFRNARFVMGADTFNRLTVNNDSIWAELESSNNKLYVFPRLNFYGHPIVMEYPIEKKHLIEFAVDFEPKNIASRDIRRRMIQSE